MATAIIESILQFDSKAEIDFLTAKTSLPLLECHPGINQIYAIDLEKMIRFFFNPFIFFKIIFNAISWLKRKEYDYAIDLQGLERSVFFLYFCKAKVKSSKNNYPFLISFKDFKLHALDELYTLCQQTGINLRQKSMRVYVKEEWWKDLSIFVQEKFDLSLEQVDTQTNNQKKIKKYFIFSPFTRWQTKDWDLERVKEFITYINSVNKISNNKNLWFFCGDEKYQLEMELFFKKHHYLDWINLSGKISLREFIALVDKCQAMICADSFALHLGAALNKKQVALFGPTWEERLAPRNGKTTVIRDKKCNKCYRRNCKKECMKNIKAKTVFDAFQNLMGGFEE